jgi:hypothetical protein
MSFAADSSRILIIYEAVTLHWWVKLRRARSWIMVQSLIIGLLGILESIKRLPERHTVFGFLISLLHLFLIKFNSVTCVDNWPLHSDVFWRKIRIGSKLKRGFVKSIISLLCLLSPWIPWLVSCLEFLLNNCRTISSLRSVSIDVNITHCRCVCSYNLKIKI